MNTDAMSPNEAEAAPLQQDLLKELMKNLANEFDAALKLDPIIPAAARKALVELLKEDSITTKDIFVAISKNDPGNEAEASE